MKTLAKYGNQEAEIKVIKRDGPLLQVAIGEREYILDVEKVEEGVYSVINNNRSHNMEIIKSEKKDLYTVNTRYKTFDIEIASAIPQAGKSRAKNKTEQIKAPIPGTIVSVKGAAGDPAKENQTLVVLSAMKMENELKSPINGIISGIYVKEGDVVREGTILAEVKEVT
jgi:biotin carboxyl carrier protein